MNQDRFAVIVINAQDRSRRVLVNKAKEYAPGKDRLSNFKKAAALQGISSEQALFGMLTKHLVSLAEMACDPNNTPSPRAMWEEKLTDAINYLHLLEAVVAEKDGWS